MACTLTLGRLKACKEGVGGIKKMWVIDYNVINAPAAALVFTDEVLTGGTFNPFEYDLPQGTASFNQEIKASKENGTVYFEQNLEISLFSLTTADRKELATMARMNLVIFVEDYNQNIFMLGTTGGCDTVGGSASSGQAKGDFQGYKLNFQAEEPDMANFVDPYTSVPWDQVGLTVVPVVGT